MVLAAVTCQPSARHCHLSSDAAFGVKDYHPCNISQTRAADTVRQQLTLVVVSSASCQLCRHPARHWPCPHLAPSGSATVTHLSLHFAAQYQFHLFYSGSGDLVLTCSLIFVITCVLCDGSAVRCGAGRWRQGWWGITQPLEGLLRHLTV